jgi:hypothetical protein
MRQLLESFVLLNAQAREQAICLVPSYFFFGNVQCAVLLKRRKRRVGGFIRSPGATRQTLLPHLSVSNPRLHLPDPGSCGATLTRRLYFLETEKRTGPQC